ncbi:DUF938 domain-containing protein [Acidovorax sp. sic0104]|uniref:DUF938 domain-containing protein n=1 Tax=Acidovorax sp. sic0104 TaxID=2854784 RepID=UPI001C494DAB|nr:DUF938 domain-containing protein [Acidovorax sp. sic0104]MBV7542723.1 DUF938 domain-containing protein [Acidovorax sp. sic0104]
MSDLHLLHSPAAERNSAPILACLQPLLAPQGRALEIASGTGQHAAHFGAALPGWTWQPSDLHSTHFGSIAGWAAKAGAGNVLPPVLLDVMQTQWPADGASFTEEFDLIYCANMLHIAPWACCAGLVQGAARHLAPGGRLATYGPYLEDNVPTAAGNLAFDASLRAQDSAWGIRRLEDVAATAAAAGLALQQRHALPANNLLLVWARAEGSAP